MKKLGIIAAYAVLVYLLAPLHQTLFDMVLRVSGIIALTLLAQAMWKRPLP